MKANSRREFLGEIMSGCGSGALGLSPSATLPQMGQSPHTINVREFGAVGDGNVLNTGRLQDAIDACARAGGGTVRFPAGIY
jgi:polygalacturonase